MRAVNARLPQGGPSRAWSRASAAIAMALVLLSLAAGAAQAGPRGGYIVVDMQSGAVLDSYRSREPMRPASLTKMMTLYLTFEAIRDGELEWDQTLTVSGHAASMTGQRLGLRRGERITVRQAVLATAIHSANDAAVTLAEAVGGSEHDFTVMMTAKARALGMPDTTFGTASGLYAPEQYTTPRDMATLARHLYFDFPENYHIFGRTSFTYRGRRRGATNGLLTRRGVDGMKTGYTRRAGYNLAASALRRNRRVLVVLMGGASSRARNNAVLALLDDGFAEARRRDQRGTLLAGDRLDLTPRGGPLRAPRPTPRFAALRERIDAGAIETASIREAPEAAVIAARVTETLATRQVATTDLASPELEAVRAEGGGPARDWSVQIGAFIEEDRANTLLRTVMRRHSEEISGAFQSVLPVERRLNGRDVTLHRARFTGLDRASAAALCVKMSQARQPCVIVPPDGWVN